MIIEQDNPVLTNEDEKNIQWIKCHRLDDEKIALFLKALFVFSKAVIFWGFTYIWIILCEWRLEGDLYAWPISILIGMIPIIFYKITLKYYDESEDNKDITYAEFKALKKLPVEIFTVKYAKKHYPVMVEDINSGYKTKLYVTKSKYDIIKEGKEFREYKDR